MSDPIKIGSKGRHVKIPDGWEIVTSGVCKEGDRFLDATTANLEGKVNWIFASKKEEDVGEPFDLFDLLIREKK